VPPGKRWDDPAQKIAGHPASFEIGGKMTQVIEAAYSPYAVVIRIREAVPLAYFRWLDDAIWFANYRKAKSGNLFIVNIVTGVIFESVECGAWVQSNKKENDHGKGKKVLRLHGIKE